MIPESAIKPIMLDIIKQSLKKVWSIYLSPDFGELGYIVQHRQDLNKSIDLEKTIGYIQKRWSDLPVDFESKPIFILSAGWRSGSTLLQRLVMSSGQVLIWGEPYHNCNLIEKLSSSLQPLHSRYPYSEHFLSHHLQSNSSELFSEWIAVLNPDINHLIEAHLNFIRTLFKIPAQGQGYTRWGLKEVRLTIEHAIYLNWLFPNAKFLLLYRNPYKSYTSYRGKYWYYQYPNQPVYTAKQFAQVWENLASGFLTQNQKINSVLIKYEDLCEKKIDFQKLEEFLEVEINPDILDLKVRGNIAKPKTISNREKMIVKKYTEPTSSQLGYMAE